MTRTTLTAAILALFALPTTAMAIPLSVTDAPIFYDDLGGGTVEIATFLDVPGDGTLDLVLGFGPDTSALDGGFLEIDGSAGRLASLPRSVSILDEVLTARFAVDPGTTETGKTRDLLATITFEQDVASLAAGNAYSAQIDLATVPLPAGAILLASGLFGLGILRKKSRNAAPSIA